jgi:tRNA (guanosine-2'-O-)-methyltransferase
VACAVSLYEAFRQKQAEGHYNQQKLNADEYSTLFNRWELNNE